MPASNPRWLDIVRHNIRGYRAPYLLILQHHEIPAPNRLVAPIAPKVPGQLRTIAPTLIIGGTEYRARPIDTSAVPLRLTAETIRSALDESDAILAALDIILHGYPVGRYA